VASLPYDSSDEKATEWQNTCAARCLATNTAYMARSGFRPSAGRPICRVSSFRRLSWRGMAHIPDCRDLDCLDFGWQAVFQLAMRPMGRCLVQQSPWVSNQALPDVCTKHSVHFNSNSTHSTGKVPTFRTALVVPAACHAKSPRLRFSSWSGLSPALSTISPPCTTIRTPGAVCVIAQPI
jgi:hypothetical protein